MASGRDRSDPSGCAHLFSLRRTGDAARKMQHTLRTSSGTLSTQNETDLFKKIRHESRVIEKFDQTVQDSKTWPVIYTSKDPYESALVQNITCQSHSVTDTSSIYMNAKLCAPAIHSICLMWAVEYMSVWCPCIKNAFVLEDIDLMSRYVMLHIEPGMLSMYKTVVAFVKLSVVELNEGGTLQVGISVENMNDTAIEQYKNAAGKHWIAKIYSIVVCVRPLTDELDFELSVLYTRRVKKNIFTYLHDCVWMHFVMPTVWQLSAMATRTAMLDRNAVCLESWIHENKKFYIEIKRKLQRGTEPYTPPSPPPTPPPTRHRPVTPQLIDFT